VTAEALVALSHPRNQAERDRIERWAEDLRSTGALVHVEESPATATDRAKDGDLLIVPVRVVRPHSDSPGPVDFLNAAAETVTPARLRSRVRGQYEVSSGAPARLSELQARWDERSTSRRAHAPEAFHAFVGRQAEIALERASRERRGDRFRKPRAVVEELISQRQFVEGTEALAQRLGRSPEGVLSDARHYLEEMASQENRLVIDLWARITRKMHSRAYRLEIDAAQVERLRTLSATHPLVFLPSHRSNLDPYVMTSVTYDHGLPNNHVLGGINMAFWPLGPLARRVGAVFIRRTFKDNEVYRFALARYLGFLVSKRFNLEWYLEGGRSRTGKLLPPKLGLLNYLSDAVEEMDLRDVLLVPTSIVYDLLNEAGEMTAESRGEVKKPEGLAWYLRYIRMQTGRLGAIHVRFGEPLNLHDALTAQAGTDRRLARNKVAIEVCTRINEAAVVTAPALVSFALLGVGQRALTIGEVRSVLAPVLTYASQRALPMDAATRDLETRAGVERTLEQLVQHGVVERFEGGSEVIHRIGPDRELLAAFYRNGTIHRFVVRAIVELALLEAGRSEPASTRMDVFWDEALQLRDLLKFEFFFAERDQFRVDVESELTLIDPEWKNHGITCESGRMLGTAGALVSHRVLQSFAESYQVVAHRLVALGSGEADAEKVVRDCRGWGQQYLLQGKVSRAESVSSHLFKTALQLADNRGLLERSPRVELRRAQFAHELDRIVQQLDELHQYDRLCAPLEPGVPA
jgi:glycerol-3-phosphate O-acyltransferase